MVRILIPPYDNPTVKPDAVSNHIALKQAHDDQQAELRDCQSKIDDCNGQAPQTHDDHNRKVKSAMQLRHGPMETIYFPSGEIN